MYKKIGNTFYVHKSNINELFSLLDKCTIERVNVAKDHLPETFDYEIIKFDKKNNKVSFISSPDWNSAREPIVGDSYTTDIVDIAFKVIKSKGQIYHHKWMFVSDDYTGFDVKESKDWSNLWTELLPRDRNIKSRIGYKKYWNEILNQFNLPLDEI